MGRLYIFIGLSMLMAVGTAGILLLNRQDRKKHGAEMSKRDVQLYREAAKMLSRLKNLQDINGDEFTTSGDFITDNTHKAITEWLDRYTKEISK